MIMLNVFYVFYYRWIFLEGLGFISFFGVLLIETQSYRLALTMCMLTVFSITLFCYVLADFDSPLHGTMKINLEPLLAIVLSLESFHGQGTGKSLELQESEVLSVTWSWFKDMRNHVLMIQMNKLNTCCIAIKVYYIHKIWRLRNIDRIFDSRGLIIMKRTKSDNINFLPIFDHLSTVSPIEQFNYQSHGQKSHQVDMDLSN